MTPAMVTRLPNVPSGCSSMTSALAPFYSLPQELVDLIIDKVASQSHTTVYRDQPKIIDIVTCSLVCKAFYSRAQAHLLSRLHIRADKDFRNRARVLLNQIRSRTSDSSVPILNSLCCAVVDNTEGNPGMLDLHSKGSMALPTPTGLDRLAAHLGDHFLQFLHTASNPEYEIQHFSLVAMSELHRPIHPPFQIGEAAAFQTTLSEACTAVSLRTLHLANLANIPRSTILEVFFLPCLEELTLNNLSFSAETDSEGAEISAHIMAESGNFRLRTVAPKLKRLEIRNISYLGLFNCLLNLSSPSSCSSSAFACLDGLIISLLFDDRRFPIFGALTTIWNFMVRVASTLKSLEIESYAYPIGPHVQKHFNSHSTRICLGRLPSLRTFRLTICHDTSLDFLKRLLMDSKRNPTTIESFEIKVTLSALDKRPLHTFMEHQYWTKLDDRLTSLMFPRLQRVRIIIVLFHAQAKKPISHESTKNITTGGDRVTLHSKIRQHWESIFPKVASSRSLVVDVHDIYSKNTLGAYQYASRTDDGITN